MVNRLLIFLFLVVAMPMAASAQLFNGSDTIAAFLRDVDVSKFLIESEIDNDTVAVKQPEKIVQKKKKTAKLTGKTKPAKSVKTNKRRTPPANEKKVTLGKRVIMRGDYGSDIRKLADILVKNVYLEEDSIRYTADGQTLYEGQIIQSVKAFQKGHDLYPDGMVDSNTIKALRKIASWR